VTSKPGVLINANARRVRRDPGLVDRLRRLATAHRVRLTSGPEAVVPALDALLSQGIDALVIVGGDGTMAGTLTPLLRRFPAEDVPVIVPTRGGTVNTIATSLGARGSPDRALARLLEKGAAAPRLRAPVRVAADSGEPLYGFIFVNGAGARWLDLYYEEARMGARAAASLVARITASALVGSGLARRVFAPFEADLVVDGEAIARRRYTAMAASGVRHIGLGFRPFHSAGSDPERVHLATTDAGPARLALELPALRAGWQGSCLDHFSTHRSLLRTPQPQPWSLDADGFPPVRSLEIGAGPALRFACP
jgi:diacylglycerol kinase family enzyme